MGNTPFVNAAEDSKLAPTSEERRRKIAEAKAFIQRALADGPGCVAGSLTLGPVFFS